MFTPPIRLWTIIIVGMMLLFLSCKDKGNRYGIFTVNEDQTSVEMNGTINRKSLDKFNKLYAAYPNIKTINIKNCDGSSDDETNLLLSKRVHDLEINTHLLDNASIASGGVDFFLAGIKRTRDDNTQVGVHSWEGDGHTATDFPEGHSNHQPYIDYYQSVGFTEEEAKKFYYFTINAAPASEIHWMTESEIEEYKIFKE